ncbi:hypothetical protein L484_006440 [Morus notabilis]|uniref:Uncharacterized protein n=1 Tax=Morus notabilis TaxID=981085 RepID=W9S588_9ROSA|nr:hypothetical protein L484_006440 [Morus notabilis]
MSVNKKHTRLINNTAYKEIGICTIHQSKEYAQNDRAFSNGYEITYTKRQGNDAAFLKDSYGTRQLL